MSEIGPETGLVARKRETVNVFQNVDGGSPLDGVPERARVELCNRFEGVGIGTELKTLSVFPAGMNHFPQDFFQVDIEPLKQIFDQGVREFRGLKTRFLEVRDGLSQSFFLIGFDQFPNSDSCVSWGCTLRQFTIVAEIPDGLSFVFIIGIGTTTRGLMSAGSASAWRRSGALFGGAKAGRRKRGGLIWASERWRKRRRLVRASILSMMVGVMDLGKQERKGLLDGYVLRREGTPNRITRSSLRDIKVIEVVGELRKQNDELRVVPVNNIGESAPNRPHVDGSTSSQTGVVLADRDKSLGQEVGLCK